MQEIILKRFPHLYQALRIPSLMTNRHTFGCVAILVIQIMIYDGASGAFHTAIGFGLALVLCRLGAMSPWWKSKAAEGNLIALITAAGLLGICIYGILQGSKSR